MRRRSLGARYDPEDRPGGWARDGGRLIEGWVPIYRRSGERVQLEAARYRLIKRNRVSARYLCGLYRWAPTTLDPRRIDFYETEEAAVWAACREAAADLQRIEEAIEALRAEAVAVVAAVEMATQKKLIDNGEDAA